MRKPPQPRTSYFMGRAAKPQYFEAGTWLEDESMTYPSGGFKRRAYAMLRRNEYNPVDLPYGAAYIVRASVPDTYFTIPARLRYHGKTIRGFLSMEEKIELKYGTVKYEHPVLTFTPEAAQ